VHSPLSESLIHGIFAAGAGGHPRALHRKERPLKRSRAGGGSTRTCFGVHPRHPSQTLRLPSTPWAASAVRSRQPQGAPPTEGAAAALPLTLLRRPCPTPPPPLLRQDSARWSTRVGCNPSATRLLPPQHPSVLAARSQTPCLRAFRSAPR
jgi:hypothetical protein